MACIPALQDPGLELPADILAELSDSSMLEQDLLPQEEKLALFAPALRLKENTSPLCSRPKLLEARECH